MRVINTVEKLKKDTKLCLFIIWLIALCLRACQLVLHYGESFVSGLVLPQIQAANSLLDGQGLIVNGSTLGDPPGMAAVLFLLWKIFPRGAVFPLELLQALIDSSMVFLVFSIFRTWRGEFSAWIAASAYAIYLPQAYLATRLNHYTWAVWFSVIFIYLAVSRKGSPVKMGMLAGLGMYFRSELLVVPFFWVIARWPLMRERLSRVIIAGVLSLAGILVIVLPWSFYNLTHEGSPRLIRHSFWLSFYAGLISTSPFFASADNVTDEMLDEAARKLRYMGSVDTGYTRIMRDLSIKHMKEKPLDFPKGVMRRFVRVWHLNSVWGIENWFSPGSIPDYMMKISKKLLTILSTFIGFYFFLKWGRKNPELLAAGLGIIAGLGAVYCALHMSYLYLMSFRWLIYCCFCAGVAQALCER
ncbi:hypothetical protein ACFL6Y_07305, partial [Elusimicrobiota bacterium]